MLAAAPARRFVCCTEAVAEGQEPVETVGKMPEPVETVGKMPEPVETVGKMPEPVETVGKMPEPPEPEPLQAVEAQEQSPPENGSNQPQPGGVGVTEQAEAASPAVKEEPGPCSPPKLGKYSS